MKYNENFFKLNSDYIFSDLAQKVASKKSQGGEKIIDLGIGDIKQPLFSWISGKIARFRVIFSCSSKKRNSFPKI